MTPLLPYLQACLKTNVDIFSKSLLSLLTYPLTILNSDGKTSGLSKIELTKACIRMIFLRISQMRRKGFSLSLLYLVEKMNSLNLSKNISREKDEFKYGDMFLFDDSDSISYNQEQRSFQNISTENISKLWQVITDNNVTHTLRYSAVEQIAILFEGKKNTAFRHQGRI